MRGKEKRGRERTPPPLLPLQSEIVPQHHAHPVSVAPADPQLRLCSSCAGVKAGHAASLLCTQGTSPCSVETVRSRLTASPPPPPPPPCGGRSVRRRRRRRRSRRQPRSSAASSNPASLTSRPASRSARTLTSRRTDSSSETTVGVKLYSPDPPLESDVTPVGAVPASLSRSVGQMAASPPSPPFRLLRPTREQALWPFEEQPRRRTLYGTTHLAWTFPTTRRLNL